MCRDGCYIYMIDYLCSYSYSLNCLDSASNRVLLLTAGGPSSSHFILVEKRFCVLWFMVTEEASSVVHLTPRLSFFIKYNNWLMYMDV